MALGLAENSEEVCCIFVKISERVAFSPLRATLPQTDGLLFFATAFGFNPWAFINRRRSVVPKQLGSEFGFDHLHASSEDHIIKSYKLYLVKLAESFNGFGRGVGQATFPV